MWMTLRPQALTTRAAALRPRAVVLAARAAALRPRAVVLALRLAATKAVLISSEKWGEVEASP